MVSECEGLSVISVMEAVGDGRLLAASVSVGEYEGVGGMMERRIGWMMGGERLASSSHTGLRQRKSAFVLYLPGRYLITYLWWLMSADHRSWR